ncbi:MAG: hypothetical protein M3Y64_05655, partial [Gemmatimonadota bacterium]|nr:hypothetical protein [Gemmatimonadota bacterium]
SSKVRLTKTAEQYRESRETRRELSYEALLASGRTAWSVGERVRIYRQQGSNAGAASTGGVVSEIEEGGEPAHHVDKRDYDVEYYARLLRDSFAERLQSAYSGEDFATLFSDPRQPSLFTQLIETIKPILTRQSSSVLANSTDLGTGESQSATNNGY